MTARSLRLSDKGSARIVEIFSSIQGEGIHLGERQVFVRFGGCNLHCDYCDEPDTIPIPSGRIWRAQKIRSRILSFKKDNPVSIAWTGGEPLLHSAFLEPMMRWAHGRGFKNYLETNGTLTAALKKLAPLCDTIAADLKLPSATGRQTWAEHREFLRVAPEKTFAKVVLTRDSTSAEWKQVIALMKEAGPSIPLVLQPATTFNGVEGLAPRDTVTFLTEAKAALKDVRIVPQWHPIWGVP